MSRLWSAQRGAVATLLAALGLLVAWDLLGADLPLDRLFGTAAGFALRENFWTARVVHDGGRWLAGVALLALLADTLRRPAQGPSRQRRLAWLGVVLLSLLLVPVIKRVSLTSCPWDLAEFGGSAAYVPHWLFAQADGGPGHCFPSGHAVSAFGFLGVHYLWRDHDARRARAALLAVLALGTLFGAAQVMRGAHHLSHVLWSAWLCWAVAWTAHVAQGLLQLQRRRQKASGPDRHPRPTPRTG